MNAPSQYMQHGYLRALEQADARPPAQPALQPLLERIETELERGLVVLPAWSTRTERARRALLGAVDDEALARALAQDAVLAVRVLAFANSAPHGRGALALAELVPAIRRIGHLNLAAIVYAHALVQVGGSPLLLGQRTELSGLWHQSTAAAAFARRIAWRTGGDADLAFLCGLLHNSGRTYLLARCALLGLASALAEVPAALLWRWQARLGAALVRAWELPAEVGRVLARQARLGGHTGDESGAIVAAAARAVAADTHDASTALLLAEESGIGLDAGQWRELMARAASEALALRVLLGQ